MIPSIRRLLEKRGMLIEMFKLQTDGYLYAQRTAAEARLPALAPAAWADATDLLAHGPLAASGVGSGAAALAPVGDLPANQLQAFAAELRRALASRELLVSSDLRQTSRCTTQLLLTAPGVAKREQLRQLREQLALQGSPVAGWVLLDTSLEA